jgi:hypothetical protein
MWKITAPALVRIEVVEPDSGVLSTQKRIPTAS